MLLLRCVIVVGTLLCVASLERVGARVVERASISKHCNNNSWAEAVSLPPRTGSGKAVKLSAPSIAAIALQQATWTRSHLNMFCSTHAAGHGSVVSVGNWSYIRLYKCNNNGILDLMRKWPQPQHKVVFTFVRDPISRFLSGYRELEYRYRCSAAEIPSNTGLTFVNEAPGSLARAEAFLRDLTDGDVGAWNKHNPEAAYQHVCPMFNARGFGSTDGEQMPVHVGKLDAFEDSLTALSRVAGVQVSSVLAQDTGGHASEMDHVARREMEAMVDLLNSSPAWAARLVVARLLPDICLFGYNNMHNITCGGHTFPPGLTDYFKLLV